MAKLLDEAVAGFHRRPLTDHYPVLMLDGVVLSRKTGLGALRRPVLVALGFMGTAVRRSSTTAWPPPRVPPSGSCSSPTSTADALKERTSR